MADSSQERTEPATARKLREARRKGNVAWSRDLASALVVAVGAGALAFGAGSSAAWFLGMTEELYGTAVRETPDAAGAAAALMAASTGALELLLPVLLTIFAIAVLVPFLQIRALFAVDKLIPKLENLDPIRGMKRLFFEPKTYVEFVKSSAKVALITLIVVAVLHRRFDDLLGIVGEPLGTAVTVTVEVLLEVVAWGAAGFLFVGLVDVPWQQRQFARDQRMTKDERKRDHKQSEGDPEMKGRRKAAWREMAENRMMQELEQHGADVVARNPTEIACALRFDPDRDAVPRLVARGRGEVAKRILEIARRKRIPMRRDVPLARSLVKLDPDASVPKDLYDAVRAIYEWVAEEAREDGEVAPWEERLAASEREEDRSATRRRNGR